MLPPSFPFGGMENPRITFATPTVLAGDKSLVGLLAHELAHSWSGNLVTNATWSDFWLNEGTTTYIENRIVEELYGKEVAEMQVLLGQRDLHEQVADPKTLPADTRLHIDLAGRDPDDGMTSVRLRQGRELPPPAREPFRARPLRRLPARLVRLPPLPERHHRDVRGGLCARTSSRATTRPGAR